jgi:hypothetical protein
MAARGLTGSDIRVNRAGIACSGEVCAKFWDPTKLDFLMSVCVEASVLGNSREDRVIIIARKDELGVEVRRRKEVIKSTRLGRNEYPSTELDSMQLASWLLRVYSDGRYTTPAFELIEPEPSLGDACKPSVESEGLRQLHLLDV